MGRLPLLSTMSENNSSKNFMFFPEWGWMIIVGLLLAILVLMDVVPGKAWTVSDDSVILYDYVNMRFIKGTTDDDDNVYHPGVSQFHITSVSYNGANWVDSPEYVSNTFGTNALCSCILAPPSTWVDENLSTFHRIACGSSVQTIAIAPVSDSRVSGLGSGVYFEGGDGSIYAVFSDELIYLKNKDQRGVSGVYYVLPYVDSSGVYVYKWTGTWNYLGLSTFSDTSVTDSIAVSTLLYGGFTWGDFVYDWNRALGTDNFGFYDGVLPRLDVCSSLFVGSEDAPVDPEPELVSEYFIFKRNNDYYMVEILASGFGRPVDVSLQGNNICSKVLTDYSDLENVFEHSNIFVNTSNYSGIVAYYSFDSLSEVRLYSVGRSLPSQDFDFIKENYSYQVASGSSLGTSKSFYENSSGNLGACGYFSSLDRLYSFSVISYSSGFYLGNSVSSVPDTSFRASSNFFDTVYSASVNNPLYWGYVYGFRGASGAPEPTPTIGPTPTAEPTPSATPIPSPGGTIIIVTPVPVTPTPFIDVNIPSSPGGDLDGDTTDGILSTGFEFIRTGGSPGLLSTAFSFVPDELQYLIWFLIFLLIILATLKLILHFGG